MKILKSSYWIVILILLMGCDESVDENKTILKTEFLQYTSWSGTLESIQVTFNISIQFTTDKRGVLFIKYENNSPHYDFEYSIDGIRILNVGGDVPMILNGVWLLEEIDREYLYLSQNHFGESKGRLLKLHKNN